MKKISAIILLVFLTLAFISCKDQADFWSNKTKKDILNLLEKEGSYCEVEETLQNENYFYLEKTKQDLIQRGVEFSQERYLLVYVNLPKEYQLKKYVVAVYSLDKSIIYLDLEDGKNNLKNYVKTQKVDL